jgi:hypothetical protein
MRWITKNSFIYLIHVNKKSCWLDILSNALWLFFLSSDFLMWLEKSTEEKEIGQKIFLLLVWLILIKIWWWWAKGSYCRFVFFLSFVFLMHFLESFFGKRKKSNIEKNGRKKERKLLFTSFCMDSCKQLDYGKEGAWKGRKENKKWWWSNISKINKEVRMIMNT